MHPFRSPIRPMGIITPKMAQSPEISELAQKKVKMSALDIRIALDSLDCFGFEIRVDIFQFQLGK